RGGGPSLGASSAVDQTVARGGAPAASNATCPSAGASGTGGRAPRVSARSRAAPAALAGERVTRASAALSHFRGAQTTTRAVTEVRTRADVCHAEIGLSAVGASRAVPSATDLGGRRLTRREGERGAERQAAVAVESEA